MRLANAEVVRKQSLHLARLNSLFRSRTLVNYKYLQKIIEANIKQYVDHGGLDEVNFLKRIEMMFSCLFVLIVEAKIKFSGGTKRKGSHKDMAELCDHDKVRSKYYFDFAARSNL